MDLESQTHCCDTPGRRSKEMSTDLLTDESENEVNVLTSKKYGGGSSGT